MNEREGIYMMDGLGHTGSIIVYIWRYSEFPYIFGTATGTYAMSPRAILMSVSL